MSLADTVGGIGCIARDSIQTTGKDVLFLSNSGVRSFARTIVEKSAPLGDLSKNVRNDLMQVVASEDAAAIKSVYSESEAFYLLTLPTVKEVYCFDTRGQLQDGAFRVTNWDSIEPTALLSRRNGDLLIGKNGYIGKYGTYQDHTSAYRMQYYTNHADLGNANITSILKRLKVVVIGGTNQYLTLKWGFDFSTNYLSANALIPSQGVYEYGIAEYNIAEYGIAEYTRNLIVKSLAANAGGAGKVLQVGFEAQIQGYPISIQRVDIFTKDGKY
jgi:hypothetical protein